MDMIALTGFSLKEWEEALNRPLGPDMKTGAFFTIIISQLHQLRTIEKAGRKNK